MLFEINQIKKDQTPYDFTHMWNPKNKQMNKQNKNKLIDKENILGVTGGERGWGVKRGQLGGMGDNKTKW